MALSRRNFLKVAGLSMGTAAAAGSTQLATATVALADDDTSSDDDTETYDSDYCYAEGYEACVNLSSEGSVLLKNADDILPLAEGTCVTLLGAMSYNYVEGGTGSAGGLDDENTVLMSDAFTEAGLDVNAEGWSWLEEQCGGSRDVGESDPSGVADWTSYTAIHEFDSSVYESGKSSLTASGYTDYAIVTFGRSGAEGASPSMDYDGDGDTLTGTTYLELDDNEKAVLEFAAENYTHTIVLVNSAIPIECGFVDDDSYNIDAVLWIGHPGEAGVVGVGTLLTGRACPSGRTVDTWAYDVTTNPTYYNTDDNRYANADNQTFYQYEEGIYVGYRFFETAAAAGYFDSSDFTSHSFKNGTASGYDEVVQYPFGYGLSYTTFTEEITASDVTLTAGGTNTVTVTVTNTGSVSGKRVVELYMEAPYQTDTENFGIKGVGLEKAKVVLVAFGKTSELAAGSSEDVTLSFYTDDLASFDNFGQGCYVLEAGTYKFNVQDDAHHWGESGSDNAATDTVEVTLDASIIYDESGDVDGATYAGARYSDVQVAKNAMDDVTAGDGCMLDGYLSRSDFAGGMDTIMEHQSDEAANEYVSDAIEEALALSGTETMEYSYETYIKGVKTTLTKTIYSKGADMMPFGTATPDGTDVSSLDFPEWEQVYYVVDGETDDDGLISVVDTEPSSGDYHTLSVDDMADVPIDTEAGLAIWDKLASMTTIDEAIEIQGNSGWNVSAISTVGKPAQKCQDGPGEAANGTFAGNTWFPCAVTICATWNTTLAREEGVAYGHQAILAGVGGAYIPAMNTHRSPFGGRNFEYYSEDGFIAGKIGGNVCAGVMSTGTNIFPKHYALNDGDTNRGGNTTWANEQAIREIYCRPYEISCKEFGANGMMGSLNRIGMTWWHYGFYVTMTRDEWGWQGFLITDGDGSDGDTYNNPQALLCSKTAVLNRGCYINAASTVAAFGDATEYAYGQQCLHDVIRYALYQYAGAHGTDEEGNTITASSGASDSTSSSSSDGGISTGVIVGGAIAVVAVAAVAAVAVSKSKKKKAEGADEADEAEDDSDDNETEV